MNCLRIIESITVPAKKMYYPEEAYYPRLRLEDVELLESMGHRVSSGSGSVLKDPSMLEEEQIKIVADRLEKKGYAIKLNLNDDPEIFDPEILLKLPRIVYEPILHDDIIRDNDYYEKELSHTVVDKILFRWLFLFAFDMDDNGEPVNNAPSHIYGVPNDNNYTHQGGVYTKVLFGDDVGVMINRLDYKKTSLDPTNNNIIKNGSRSVLVKVNDNDDEVTITFDLVEMVSDNYTVIYTFTKNHTYSLTDASPNILSVEGEMIWTTYYTVAKHIADNVNRMIAKDKKDYINNYQSEEDDIIYPGEIINIVSYPVPGKVIPTMSVDEMIQKLYSIRPTEEPYVYCSR